MAQLVGSLDYMYTPTVSVRRFRDHDRPANAQMEGFIILTSTPIVVVIMFSSRF
jgi:hypothetical protein